MNSLVRDFYRKKDEGDSSFSEVLFLSVWAPDWESAAARSGVLSRGWFELSRLSVADRIEFVRDFWLDSLPYRPSFHSFLTAFFEKLDDLDIVLTQAKKGSLWQVEMVYSLADQSSFFCGLPACSGGEIDEAEKPDGFASPRLSFIFANP